MKVIMNESSKGPLTKKDQPSSKSQAKKEKKKNKSLEQGLNLSGS